MTHSEVIKYFHNKGQEDYPHYNPPTKIFIQRVGVYRGLQKGMGSRQGNGRRLTSPPGRCLHLTPALFAGAAESGR